MSATLSCIVTFPRGAVIVRLEEDLDVGGVGEGGAVREAVPGPRLSEHSGLVIEPEIVSCTVLYCTVLYCTELY